MTVVGVIVDAQRSTVFQDHPCRALDLDRHGVEGVTNPADFQPLAIERAVLDREPVVVGLKLLLVVEAVNDRAVREHSGGQLLARHQEIAWAAVEWHRELRTREPRTLDDRLVISCEQPGFLAELGNPYRPEIVLEKRARLVRFHGTSHHSLPAGTLQRRKHRTVFACALVYDRTTAGAKC